MLPSMHLVLEYLLYDWDQRIVGCSFVIYSLLEQWAIIRLQTMAVLKLKPVETARVRPGGTIGDPANTHRNTL